MPGFELFGEEEKKEVQKVLDTGILMRYNFDALRNDVWKAKELETLMQDKFKVNHAQLTSSGTTALITAMNVAGIGYADEVIMPAFTFVASFEAVLAVGAIPVLVNVDDTLGVCPKAVEKAITPNTKAIMPVHMSGAMADLDPLLEIAKEHNLIVLEDACQAIGGTYKGKYLGTIGDLGCFSFDFVKTITAGEGGAVVTNNKEFYLKADQYSDHGHDHKGSDRGAEEHPYIGMNYRISELHAAVGVAQFKKLDDIIAIQRYRKARLKEELAKIEGVSFRRIPDPEGDNASFLTFFMPSVKKTEQLNDALKLAGIGANFYWFNNNWHYIRKWEHLTNIKTMGRFSPELKKQMPDYDKQDFSPSDKWMSRAICSLIMIGSTDEEFEQRIKAITETVKKIVEL